MDDALPPATSARSRVIASAGCCCAGHGALGVATQERRGRWDNDALQRRAEESLTRFVWQCSANASAVQKHANQQAAVSHCTALLPISVCIALVLPAGCRSESGDPAVALSACTPAHGPVAMGGCSAVVFWTLLSHAGTAEQHENNSATA
jgi:hypothetical protein